MRLLMTRNDHLKNNRKNVYVTTILIILSYVSTVRNVPSWDYFLSSQRNLDRVGQTRLETNKVGLIFVIFFTLSGGECDDKNQGIMKRKQ